MRARDWLVDETEAESSDRDWPVEAVAERMERLVEEASELMSEDSALMDLPKHCSPLPQMSPPTVKFPFSSMESVVEPY
jgi:hypothetical protein